MADHHDHDSHSDYVHGAMDIHEHRSTYSLFMGMTKWGSLVLAVLLVFLVVLTCTQAGLIASGISAVVVAAVGFFMLKTKPDQAH